MLDLSTYPLKLICGNLTLLCEKAEFYVPLSKHWWIYASEACPDGCVVQDVATDCLLSLTTAWAQIPAEYVRKMPVTWG